MSEIGAKDQLAFATATLIGIEQADELVEAGVLDKNDLAEAVRKFAVIGWTAYHALWRKIQPKTKKPDRKSKKTTSPPRKAHKAGRKS